MAGWGMGISGTSAGFRANTASSDPFARQYNASFTRLLQKDELPLLVDFWAEWCGPCKMFAPTFAKLASSQRGVRLLKVNTELAVATAFNWQIRSIPTLMLFHRGNQIAHQAGAMSEQQLRQWLQQALAAVPR
ncbi:thioredoxin [Haliea sp.]